MELATKIKKVKLKEPIMFIGLPGIGLVGKITVEYLIGDLKAKKIGEMYGNLFPPAVVVNEKGMVELIKNEIYHYNNGKKDFIFLTGDVQPPLNESNSSYEAHYKFAKEILNIAKKLKVKKIYTFAGIDIGDERITKRPNILFATNNQKEIKHLKEKGLKAAPEGLPISGAAGLIVGLAKQEKIEATCLLGETTTKLVYGDFDAAKTMLETINKLFDLEIDLKDIAVEAKKITDAFRQVVKELKTMSKQQAESEKLSYIR